jgi:hypothetical protein
MAIKIGANLAYNGKLPNFERDSFKTKAAMKAFNENSIDEGHLSYCEEDGNIYQYKSANAVDATTGRWRIFKTDIVVDAELNGTSKNPIQNKAVFDALKLKANAVALDKYQYKYNASFVAQSDILVGALPKDTKGVDLNGFTLNVNQDVILTKSFIINGTIAVADSCVLTLAVDNCSNIIIKNAGTKEASIDITKGNFDTCDFGCLTKISGGSNNIVRNSTFQKDLNILENSNTRIYSTYFGGNINFNSDTGIVTAFGCSSNGEPTVLYGGFNASCFYNCEIVASPYLCAQITQAGDSYYEAGTIDIRKDEEAPVSSKAAYDALQLKADKTQLNNYVTTTTANTTYATKDSLNNEVNQLVEEINLKLDDTVAASTYLRKDDANTTYAKKTDITNIYKFKGTKTNYSELPKTGVVTGDVWNITNADTEHGIKAGDNVAWNGTAWDNLSGVTDLSAYATTTTTDAMSADIKKLMDKAFPFTVKVSLDKTLAKKGTSQPVKVTITPKIGDDNVDADEIMINGAEYHGATPYVYSDTATATTTYNVRVKKDDRTAQGSATITFVNPSYDGAVAADFTVTEASIKTLTEAIRSGKGGTRTFNLNNQKACIAYPKSFGAATGIKDANGFDYLASYTRSELNVNGELYYVYLLTNATTITDMKQTIS